MENEQLKTPRFSYNDIKDNDRFVLFYTDCQDKIRLSIKLKEKRKNSITLDGRVHLWQRNSKKIENTRKGGRTLC